jgi:hypothetical protein
MPSKMSQKMPAADLPIIAKELIDQMVSGPMNAEAVNATSMAFKKALIERILGAPNSAIICGTRPAPKGPARLATTPTARAARPC